MPEAAQPPSASRPRRRFSLTPIRPAAFGYDQARHLLQRAGFGGTPRQIVTLASLGPDKAVDHLLDVAGIPFDAVRADAFDKDIIRPPRADEQERLRTARRTQDEALLGRIQAERMERERLDRRQMREIQRWWLTRLIETPRPLEEKMTLFWHGHFASSYRGVEDSYHMFLQNQTFRRHALGRYADLLHAIIRDPAMLAYLDNTTSRRGRPNENLARELMELFSLGVGNYTEQDIREGARALTGHTFRDDAFHFDQRNHDDGPKTILGRSGRLTGEDFVDIILGHRACAAFITARLYRFFVADLPDNPADLEPARSAMLRRLAATLSGADYQIRPLLRRMFLSEHFYEDGIAGQQIKSPIQLVVGGVRTLETPVRDLNILLDALDLMGQNPFYPPSVKGWDGGRSWINTSTLYVRHNILAFLLTGKKPVGYDASAAADPYDPTPLLAELAAGHPGAERDPAKVIDYLLKFTLGHAPPSATATLREFAAAHGNVVTADLITGLLLLITAMPEYQLC